MRLGDEFEDVIHADLDLADQLDLEHQVVHDVAFLSLGLALEFVADVEVDALHILQHLFRQRVVIGELVEHTEHVA